LIFPIIPKRELYLLGKSYRELDEVLRWDDSVFYAVADKVSLWSAAQHAWHVASANLLMFSAIEKLYKDEAEDVLRTGGPTLPGWFVLTTGRLPRGRAKAPAPLEAPPETVRPDAVRLVQQSKAMMTSLAQRAQFLHEPKGRLNHFALGNLTALQWLKFARIHTRHHLAIVREIRNAL
jgi:hypothetical protein